MKDKRCYLIIDMKEFIRVVLSFFFCIILRIDWRRWVIRRERIGVIMRISGLYCVKKELVEVLREEIRDFFIVNWD